MLRDYVSLPALRLCMFLYWLLRHLHGDTRVDRVPMRDEGRPGHTQPSNSTSPTYVFILVINILYLMIQIHASTWTQKKAKCTSSLEGDGHECPLSLGHPASLVYTDFFPVLKRDRTVLVTFWPEDLGTPPCLTLLTVMLLEKNRGGPFLLLNATL